jgi:redox-sensitive bicupin YhaK (pirin superfamily)
MSGPVSAVDAGTDAEREAEPSHDAVEITPSREAQVGAMRVRRALPRRARRTVGAWCFLDHMGPVTVTEERGIDIGPHPHTGLQTVTWLVAGEVLHRDSLGSEQVIRPGQCNLMTAGHGVAHSEERTGRYRGELHGVQLWIAQPDATRGGPAAFEHHAAPPRVDLDGAAATILVGRFAGAESPARRDTDHAGAEIALHPGVRRAVVPLEPSYEHALVVLDGAVALGGRRVEPGALAYLGDARDELVVDADGPARVLIVGGVPFDEPVLMWWNFVARTHDEVSVAYDDWQSRGGRFGEVASPLARISTDAPPWHPH